MGGDDEIRRRGGDHPGRKGEEDLEGRTAMLEEVKKYLAPRSCKWLWSGQGKGQRSPRDTRQKG